jgi:hypothetical protein
MYLGVGDFLGSGTYQTSALPTRPILNKLYHYKREIGLDSQVAPCILTNDKGV